MSPMQLIVSCVVKKHLRDSLRYLYANPMITYSQLMVSSQKAESEYETDHNPYIKAKTKLATAEGFDGNKVGYNPDPELQRWFANEMQKMVESILSLVGKAVKPIGY